MTSRLRAAAVRTRHGRGVANTPLVLDLGDIAAPANRSSGTPDEPLRGTVTVALRFKADVLSLAMRSRQRFETYPPPSQGYETWQAGSAFLWDIVHDSLKLGLEPTPGLRDCTAFADPDIAFGWSEASAQELSDRLGMRPPHPGEQFLLTPPVPIERPHEPMWVKGSVRATLRFEIDPVLLVEHRRDDFARHPPAKQGYEPWEAMSTFVAEVVYEKVIVEVADDEALYQLPETTEAQVHFHWTEDMAERLGLWRSQGATSR